MFELFLLKHRGVVPGMIVLCQRFPFTLYETEAFPCRFGKVRSLEDSCGVSKKRTYSKRYYRYDHWKKFLVLFKLSQHHLTAFFLALISSPVTSQTFAVTAFRWGGLAVATKRLLHLAQQPGQLASSQPRLLLSSGRFCWETWQPPIFLKPEASSTAIGDWRWEISIFFGYLKRHLRTE